MNPALSLLLHGWLPSSLSRRESNGVRGKASASTVAFVRPPASSLRPA